MRSDATCEPCHIISLPLERLGIEAVDKKGKKRDRVGGKQGRKEQRGKGWIARDGVKGSMQISD